MLSSQSFGVACWVGGVHLQLTAKTAAASVFKWTPRLKYYAALVFHFGPVIFKPAGLCLYFVSCTEKRNCF